MKDIMKPMEQHRTAKGKSGTRVARQFNKTTEFINSYGDVIDPVTKQIIKRNSGPDRDE